jgi:hypothetical protein
MFSLFGAAQLSTPTGGIKRTATDVADLTEMVVDLVDNDDEDEEVRLF